MKWFFAFLLLTPATGWGQTNTALAESCVRHYATRYGVPVELVTALIDVESRWNPRAVSSKGALGLMQLMPETARRFGAYQPFDPAGLSGLLYWYALYPIHYCIFEGMLHRIAAIARRESAAVPVPL